MKGVDRVVAHSTYYVTKQPLAPRDKLVTRPPLIDTVFLACTLILACI